MSDDDDDDDGIESLACLYVCVCVCITGLRRSHLCSDVIRTRTYLFIATTSQIIRWCAGMESQDENLVSRIRLLLVEQE